MHAARDLRDYLALLRRRKIAVLSGVVLVLALGILYLALAPKTYVSSAKVLVLSADSDVTAQGARTTDDVNLDTEAQVVTAMPVSALAKDSLDTSLDSVQLARRVTVTVPPNTTVLAISFRASSPEDAQAGAQAFANAYLTHRSDTAEARLAGQISHVNTEIRDVKTKLTVVKEKLADPATTTEVASLQARRELLTTQFNSLSAQLAALKGLVVRPGTVLNAAQAPKAPRTPDPLIVLPGAVFGGLLLGLLLALWVDARDPRVHDGNDIDRLFGVVPLAQLRVSSRRRRAPQLVPYEVRALYRSLKANGLPENAVLLCVAPDAPGLGEAFCDALSEAAALSGADVVQLSRSGTNQEAATSSVPRHTVASSESGAVGGGSADESLQQRLLRSRAESDLVILGLSSKDAAVDDLLLAECIDAVVIVVGLGKANRQTVAECLARIEATGTAALFVVSADPRRSMPSLMPTGSPPSLQAPRHVSSTGGPSVNGGLGSTSTTEGASPSSVHRGAGATERR